ncbi:malonyl-CoA decarboxylase [Paracoccus spongiarum]|uniref:Malonyl-CoA decarboxylase n=1 Tax=Paracoccus spongiarum TaxID=3064387 RepID=A0ABT9JF55_9RHOB|nr:malonyl-CoA decarboxylase [Paracoccus sp. 2205BS29-5]MDP5308455.1 malonyl-CoA decarboxylase [Paracoccus sp. 2205BS29-5]
MARAKLTFLNDLVQAITGNERRGRSPRIADEAATRTALARPAAERLAAACDVLMGRIGDAARVAIAEQALTAYGQLDAAGRLGFFQLLRDRFGADPAAIRRAFAAYDASPTAETLVPLFETVEPARQTLLRRLNTAPGATLRLVQMRADLLQAMRKQPDLAPLDADFAHLFASWFNRGFLRIQRIDWSTPADVLEKIMRYESVHPMTGWQDLRRRLDPADRRFFAFFHPATGNEPLIFVEVALTRETPDRIAPILTAPQAAEPVEADTAVFYSINNTLAGLKGVSFGNFLIKQVVAELSAELPSLKTFVTLSPAPGFAAWLASGADPRAADLAAELDLGAWIHDAGEAARLKPEVEALAATYFTAARTRSGAPRDPVARFHLGNGAAAWRVNWPGDLSDNSIRQAHGLMINYLYEPARIEAQHESFVRDGTVATGAPLRAVLER